MLNLDNLNTKQIFALLFIFACLLLIPFTRNVHLFDWDEINFAECAREMIVTNTYHTVLLNFQPFWEKPPLFIWMQILSMKLFGINEFAARFPNIVNGIITTLLLFYFGQKWYSRKFGLLWSMTHMACFLPHLYFRSGIIDPWYNLFGLLSLIGIIELLQNKKPFWAIISGISLGLAVLTKGPAMVLIIGISAILLFIFSKYQFYQKQYIKHWIIFIFVFLLSGGSWFLFEYLSGNSSIIKGFIDYQIRLFKTEDSGHAGFPLYHFVVVLFGCFPASVITIRYFSKNVSKDIYSKAFAILMLVVLIIFSIVKTKIVHYSSLTYYSISFLSTYVLLQMMNFQRWQKILMIIISFLISIVLIFASYVEKWKSKIIPLIEKNDAFAAENLKVNVHWYGYEFLCGVMLIVLSIWIFRIKHLNYQKLLLFFAGMVLWISITINSFVGKIEQYSQNSAICFFQFCADKQIDVDTYGYKSYAYLFYGRRKPLNDSEKIRLNNEIINLTNAGYDPMFSYNLAYLNWLINDDEKYPVCLVCKIQDEEKLLSTKKFIKLYSKGGYSFFMKQKLNR
jgi:4-amino-4-deoxy-L-arabinose transferase-like glycosyltransferase